MSDPAAQRHAEALKAFRFANRAMLLQRQHTTIAALREATRGMSYPRSARPRSRQKQRRSPPGARSSSRSCCSTCPRSPTPGTTTATRFDLLFFPTGGGKTEAYLGLAAYTFAIRRLQGTVNTGEDARSGDGGVAVLMRYTLRLLTAQQFQRAAALVCAAEVLRREDTKTWGDEPFRIGLWVGGLVSPNWYNRAADQITEVRDSPRSKRTGVLQTLACPWCGTKLAGPPRPAARRRPAAHPAVLPVR